MIIYSFVSKSESHLWKKSQLKIINRIGLPVSGIVSKVVSSGLPVSKVVSSRIGLPVSEVGSSRIGLPVSEDGSSRIGLSVSEDGFLG